MDLESELILFEKRKRDHIEWSLSNSSQANEKSDFNLIELIHSGIPELNFDELVIESDFFGHKIKSPYYISAMTLGHSESVILNNRLAEACEKNKWVLSLGSQRKQLFDKSASQESENLAAKYPNALIIGNLGLSQLIETPLVKVEELVKSANCKAMAIHLNPLQECLQREGTPHFKGGLVAIEKLANKLSVPVVIKETGCGMSVQTLSALLKTGVAAIDISGRGGTHWGRIEGLREEDSNHPIAVASRVFANWGISTVQSVLNARSVIGFKDNCEIWASGGVRNGLDAAKLLAIGAKHIGVAQPFLKAARENVDSVTELMNSLEYQLKIAMFCTGSRTVNDLRLESRWTKK